MTRLPYQLLCPSVDLQLSLIRYVLTRALLLLPTLASVNLYCFQGDRYNQGNYAGITSDHSRRGVYVGCIGARFERLEQMEWKHMIISKEQNIEEKGYGAKGTGASGHLLKVRYTFAVKYPSILQQDNIS